MTGAHRWAATAGISCGTQNKQPRTFVAATGAKGGVTLQSTSAATGPACNPARCVQASVLNCKAARQPRPGALQQDSAWEEAAGRKERNTLAAEAEGEPPVSGRHPTAAPRAPSNAGGRAPRHLRNQRRPSMTASGRSNPAAVVLARCAHENEL